MSLIRDIIDFQVVDVDHAADYLRVMTIAENYTWVAYKIDGWCPIICMRNKRDKTPIYFHKVHTLS